MKSTINEKTIILLLLIVSGLLALGGFILILVSIFSDSKDSWALGYAFGVIVLSNFLM